MEKVENILCMTHAMGSPVQLTSLGSLALNQPRFYTDCHLKLFLITRTALATLASDSSCLKRYCCNCSSVWFGSMSRQTCSFENLNLKGIFHIKSTEINKAQNFKYLYIKICSLLVFFSSLWNREYRARITTTLLAHLSRNGVTPIIEVNSTNFLLRASGEFFSKVLGLLSGQGRWRTVKSPY